MSDIFEHLINAYLEDQVGTMSGFLSPELTAGLRRNLLQKKEEGMMHPAGIGKHFDFQRNLEIRGDVICWIEEDTDDPFEQEFLDQMRGFVEHLNRTCYTGIRSFEFHYALYEAGSFYKRHKDQFQQDRGRQFSVVHYLNEQWQPEDGGQLRVWTRSGEQLIQPEGGRVVFFKADQTEHEVLPASRARMSIAGWLKNV